MPAAARLAALLAAVLTAAAPGAALAQDGTSTQQAPDLSQIPLLSQTVPASLHHASAPSGHPERASSLPDTGSEAWAVGGLGAALLLAGLGLRLRTRDERF